MSGPKPNNISNTDNRPNYLQVGMVQIDNFPNWWGGLGWENAKTNPTEWYTLLRASLTGYG